MSILAYRQKIRMMNALTQMATDKVDVVALSSGYQSRRNFYRTFRDLTGLTPTAFRRLAPDAITALVDAVWAGLNTRAPRQR